jgi:hypothetical protein
MSTVSGGKRLERASRVLTLLPVVALVGVLAVLARGPSPGRLRSLAAFLVVCVACEGAAWVLGRGRRRRFDGGRAGDVPRGVRLRGPLSEAIGSVLIFVAMGALLGAIPAAFGFDGVGLGVTLTMAGLGFATRVLMFVVMDQDLTFEPEGLRIHIRRASILIPWTSVLGIARSGSESAPRYAVRIRGLEEALASVRPAKPEIRSWVKQMVFDSGGRLWLPTSSRGGFDARALAFAIQKAAGGGAVEPLN